MEASKQQVTNFARFYTLLKQMPGQIDSEELKAILVRNVTNGRTESLKEMTYQEYGRCCRVMEEVIGMKPQFESEMNQLRHQRSIVLRLMQKIGVDTTDWTAINSYCLSKKIAGKEFRDLSCDELAELSVKLRMILKKAKTNNQF
jgi:hypothetical protein